MKDYLVIDGYNLLHHMDQNLSDASGDDLESRRERLSDRCQNYASLEGYQAVLVFDAYQNEDPGSVDVKAGIEVVYTAGGQTADSFIERYLYELPDKARKMVVTNDGAIQTMALLTGAERIPCGEFLSLLERAEAKTREKPRSSHGKNHIGAYVSEENLNALEKLRLGERKDEKLLMKPPRTKKKPSDGKREKRATITLRPQESFDPELEAEKRRIRRALSPEFLESLPSLEKEKRGKQTSRKEKRKRKEARKKG